MSAPRITLVTSSLTCGGAEKNVALLANEWSQRGKEVTVISFDRHPPFFTLRDAVHLVKTDITRRYSNLVFDIATSPGRLLRLRREVVETRPDVIVSFMDINNLLTLMTTRGLRIPVVVAERSDPRIWPVKKGWRALRVLLYPTATRILTQTEASKAFFPKSLQRKIDVIPNPVIPFPLDLRIPDKLNEKRILSTGRFVAMKRFDLLIRAFAALSKEFPGWALDLLGDGEEREHLTTLTQELGISNSVHFHGMVSDTAPYLQRAAIFALCSDFEGFPNSLAEALAAGIPSISTDSHGGRELVQHAKNGLLIPVRDEARLTDALRQLMGNADTRERMSREAIARTKAYSLENILQKWEDVFKSL